MFGVSMAVNHADGTMFVSVLFYPIAAGLAATSARAGWFTILFVAAGVPVGVAIAFLGRQLIYLLMGFFLRRFPPETTSTWVSWVVGGPLFLAYIILPY
jgi:hypothetical protein